MNIEDKIIHTLNFSESSQPRLNTSCIMVYMHKVIVIYAYTKMKVQKVFVFLCREDAFQNYWVRIEKR
jgi:hypothetical protein